jgi:hypothetical protein
MRGRLRAVVMRDNIVSRVAPSLSMPSHSQRLDRAHEIQIPVLWDSAVGTER